MNGFDTPFARSRQEQGRRGLLASLGAVHHYAHGTRQAEKMSRVASAALQQHNETHSDFVRLHFRSIAAFGFLLIVLIAVWWVDFLLFSSTAEYFAGKVFHGWPWLVPLACFLSPAILLLIEIGISLQRDLAREDATAGLRARALGWTTIGVLIALVVPLAAVAAAIAAQPVIVDSEGASAFRMQTAALAILAFAGHLLVLFGGRHAHEAKAFAAFKVAQWSLEARIRFRDHRAQTLADSAVAAFKDYYHQREIHNAMFPEASMEVGPFDALTRGFINERYDYDFITIITVDSSTRRRRSRRGETSAAESTEGARAHEPSRPQELTPGSASLPSGGNKKPSRRGRKPAGVV